MKTTVLTIGANDGRSLHTTYSSLLRQKRADWEWLIGIPTGATVRILDDILADSRVRVVDAPATSMHSAMVDVAAGELFVTVPPGGELSDHALVMLEKAHEKQPKAAIFSAFGCRKKPPAADTAPNADTNWWWSTFDFDRGGTRLLGCHTPPRVPALAGYQLENILPVAVPRFHARVLPDILKLAIVGQVESVDIETVTHILPDHLAPTGVKVWMAGLSATHWSEKMAERVMDTADLWAAKNDLMLIDGSVYGAADSKHIHLHPSAFLNNDSPAGWPLLAGLEANSVGRITLRDFLPYLPGPHAVRLIGELFHILKHGGILRIDVPTTRGQAAFANPAYRSWWNERTFDAFTNATIGRAAGNKFATFTRVWQTSGYRTPDDHAADMLYLDIGLAAVKNDENYPAPRGY